MFERYTEQARRVIFFARYADPDKRQNISPAVDLPISLSSVQALADATKEADRLQSEQIDCLHLALGILRDKKCFGAILLREQGVNASAIEMNIFRAPRGVGVRGRLHGMVF